jgi:hypothetical protein
LYADLQDALFAMQDFCAALWGLTIGAAKNSLLG